VRLARGDTSTGEIRRPADIRIRNAVIVRVSGGLANQMICYKVGRYAASLKHSTFIIDASLYGNDNDDTARNFQLLHYPISFDLLVFSHETMNDIRANNTIWYLTKDMLPLPDPSVEETTRLVDDIKRHEIVYCDFWLGMALRSEMDAHAVSTCVLDELRLDAERVLDSRDLACLRQIRETRNSVAIHVRRGDFATHDGNLLLTPEYYNKSIADLEHRLDDPTFFVFSDDVTWCRRELRARSNLQFVDWTDDRNAFKDMYLASQCTHFILSNESTFSHQIVQLNEFRDGRVVLTSGQDDLVRNSQSPASAV
jgi:hypothetical protein